MVSRCLSPFFNGLISHGTGKLETCTMTASELEYLPQLPRDKSPGIGCIGAGFIMADCQLVAYRKAGFNPVAIAARRREQADAVASRHRIPSVFTDYRELLRQPDVQVVDIAVPPDTQFEVIQQVVKHADHIRGV